MLPLTFHIHDIWKNEWYIRFKGKIYHCSLINGEERCHRDSKKKQNQYTTEEEGETHLIKLLLKGKTA